MRYADRDDAILAQHAIDRLWQVVRDRGRPMIPGSRTVKDVIKA